MDYEQLKLSNQLCFPLYVCSKEIIRKYTPFLEEIGLTYTKYIVMMALWEEKEINIKKLGDRLSLDSGTLTPLLKKLEKDELVVRTRQESDGRNVIISLTKKGELLKEKAKDIPSEIGSCVSLTQEESRTLYTLLYKLINNL